MKNNKVVRLSRSDLLKLYDTCLEFNILHMFSIVWLLLIIMLINSNRYLILAIPFYFIGIIIAIIDKKKLKKQGVIQNE